MKSYCTFQDNSNSYHEKLDLMALDTAKGNYVKTELKKNWNGKGIQWN